MESELPIDKRSPREYWDDQHKTLASEPLTWTLSADELFRSFELLATQAVADQEARSYLENKYVPNVRPVALMLAGFSVENMLKALYVSQNPAFSSSGRFDVATHNLRQLADNIALPLTKNERILLERLEHFLTWAGRYPVPLYSNDICPKTLPSGGFAPITSGWNGEDFQQVRAFSEKLRNLLPVISDGDATI